MAEGRPSLYSRVPIKTSAFFTDYKSRVLSHLSPNWTSLTASKKRDASKIFEPLRNSLYVKSLATPYTSSTSTSQRPTIRKASRVLLTSAEKSQRLSASVNSRKQKKVSSLRCDPVKKVLLFDSDESRVDKTVHKLQQLEQKEHLLQKEITNMEVKKGERKRKRTNFQSDTPGCPIPADLTRRELHSIEIAQQTASGPSIHEQEHRIQKNQRNPLEPLGKEEIVKRSLNFSPESDSDSDANTADKQHQYPLSPLAKDTNCKIINMTTVAHGIKSRVQQTLAKHVRKFTQHNQHSSELSQQKMPPRCTDRGREVKKKIQNDSHSTKATTTHRDLWSPSKGRVEKTTRRPLKFTKDHRTSNNSQKISGIKGRRPQFISTVSKSYKNPQKKADHSVRKASPKPQRSSVDKENVAPTVLKPPSSPVIIRYTDDDPLLTDVFNTSIEALNQSLADVTSQFDELENEAQSFLDGSEELDKDNILKQLAHIKKKQEELIRMEKQLQQQLRRESCYSAKKSQCAADRTKRCDTESGHAAAQRSLFGEKTTFKLNIPEITEKATKLEIISNSKTNEKHSVSERLYKIDKMHSTNVDCTNLVESEVSVGVTSEGSFLSEQVTPVCSVLSTDNFVEQQDKKNMDIFAKSTFNTMLEQNSPVDLSNNAQRATRASVKKTDQQVNATVDYSKGKDVCELGSLKNHPNIEDEAVVPGSQIADNIQDDVKSLSKFITPLRSPVPDITGQSSVDVTLSTNHVLVQSTDEVADNEVSLVMEKAYYGFEPSRSDRIQRCNNPLASLLEFGDNMHFVPVQEESNCNYVLQQTSRIISCT